MTSHRFRVVAWAPERPETADRAARLLRDPVAAACANRPRPFPSEFPAKAAELRRRPDSRTAPCDRPTAEAAQMSSSRRRSLVWGWRFLPATTEEPHLLGASRHRKRREADRRPAD